MGGVGSALAGQDVKSQLLLLASCHESSSYGCCQGVALARSLSLQEHTHAHCCFWLAVTSRPPTAAAKEYIMVCVCVCALHAYRIAFEGEGGLHARCVTENHREFRVLNKSKHADPSP